MLMAERGCGLRAAISVFNGDKTASKEMFHYCYTFHIFYHFIELYYFLHLLRANDLIFLTLFDMFLTTVDAPVDSKCKLCTDTVVYMVY